MFLSGAGSVVRDVRYKNLFHIAKHGLFIAPMIVTVVNIPSARELHLGVTFFSFSGIDELGWQQLSR